MTPSILTIFRRKAPPAAVRAAKLDPPRVTRFAGRGPQLEMLEWRAEDPKAPRVPPEPDSFHWDPFRRQLRDRYIQARFPGVVACGADLEDEARVVAAVRLYFEERKFDRADELLEIAIEQSPGTKALRLAQLELMYLRSEGERFVACARDFSRGYPEAAEWPQVARLGRAIAPRQTALFGDARNGYDHDRSGPSTEMPNWLEATFDLTAEVLAADFHRDMAQATPSIEPQRNAA